ncbi:MAG: hypothetical protein K2N14_02040 [Clostridia bacterium]|nr:hypothetical protein [Clostridia bacterium]
MDENVMTDGLGTEETPLTPKQEKEKKKAEKLAAKQAEKERKKAENDKLKSKKNFILSTYFVAVLCLVAGLLVPLFNCEAGVSVQERMLIRYVPSMFNNVCEFIAHRTFLDFNTIPWFMAYNVEGLSGFFVSLIGVLYTVSCVFALLMFIPVCLGSKKGNASANSALAAEVLALIVTVAYIAVNTYNIVKSVENISEAKWVDYNFLIPAGGVLLMAIVQSIVAKGGIGVSKTIAVLLSGVGVMALLDAVMFIPALEAPLAKLGTLIKCEDVGFISGLSTSIFKKGIGIEGISALIGIKTNYEIIFAPGANPMTIIVYVLVIAVSLLTCLNFVVDILGLGTGQKYKHRKPCRNAASNTFALVRYIITFLLTAAIIALTFFDAEVTSGLYLYILAAVLFINIINAAARTGAANARYKKGNVAPAENNNNIVLSDPSLAAADSYETPETNQQPAYAQEIAQQPDYSNYYAAPEQQPDYYAMPEQQPEYSPVTEQQPEEYTQPLAEDSTLDEQTTMDAYPEYDQTAYDPNEYQGYDPNAYYEQPAYEQPAYDQPASEPNAYQANEQPFAAEPLSAPLEMPAEPAPAAETYNGETDEFMDSLTDSEKKEFVEIFVKKSIGTVRGVPDYEIDGDNGDFFPAVFVHINRYRNIVSDSLMSKMYKQLGKV